MPFLTDLVTQHVGEDERGREQIQLTNDLVWQQELGSGGAIHVVVPRGYISNHASVPRGLWNLLPPSGTHTPAAVVHDFLCDSEVDLSLADQIFNQVMKETGVPWWRRFFMYAGVRIAHFWRF